MVAYAKNVTDLLLSVTRASNIREITGVQGKHEWFLFRFGCVTSTTAAAILRGERDSDAEAAEREVSCIARRQTISADIDVRASLLKHSVMAPAGSSKRATSMRIGRINEHTAASHLPEFFASQMLRVVDLGWQVPGEEYEQCFSYLAGFYDTGLVSRVMPLPDNAVEEEMDRSFDWMATSVDGICVLVDMAVLFKAGVSCNVWTKWIHGLRKGHRTQEAEAARQSLIALDFKLRVDEPGTALLVHAAVEIKTATTESTVSDARRAIRGAQKLFSCDYGSHEFRRLVPSEHHCATIGVSYAVYAKYSVRDALYTAVVYFSQDAMQSYRDRLRTLVSKHLLWLYKADLILPTATEMTVTVKKKRKINGTTVTVEDHEEYYGYTQDRHGYCYYVNCWRAMDKMVRTKSEPFRAGFSWAPGPHAMWPKQKPLLDIVSRYITHIEAGRDSNLTLSQSLAFRMILYQLYNAFVCHRVLQTIDRLKDGWSRVTRSNLSASSLLQMHKKYWAEVAILQFVTNISDAVLADSSTLMPEDTPSRPPPEASSAARESDDLTSAAEALSPSATGPVRRPKRNRLSWANSPEGKRTRLSKPVRHLPVQALSKAKNCALCAGAHLNEEGKQTRFGRQTTFVCSVCDLPLCTSTRGNDRRETSCFQKWHSAERLCRPSAYELF